MYKGIKALEQKFSGAGFHFFPTDYHTWGCPVLVLEAPLWGGSAGLPKQEPMARNRVYIGHPPFHAGSVVLLLNTITGHISL